MVNRLIWVAVFVAGLALGTAATIGYARHAITNAPEPEFHEHADFAVFLNGQRFDFARAEFMSNKPCVLETDAGWIEAAYAHGGEDISDYVHLHDMAGSVVHVHRNDVTWHGFFESLDMTFEDNVFVDRETNEYPSDDTHSFVFIINGQRVETLADRLIRDQDRVLISYGRHDRSDADVWAEYGQVSNDACLSSGTCPHRGVTPLESCGAAPEPTPNILQWIGLE